MLTGTLFGEHLNSTSHKLTYYLNEQIDRLQGNCVLDQAYSTLKIINLSGRIRRVNFWYKVLHSYNIYFFFPNFFSIQD